ncbi:HTTM domain-containing protein [Haliscomenobacter sp.]|uniref:HTTM domain-containing protein n=1 Tax=Haliscomenobacter sp. TaxID=2717303 RepID=UPI0033651F04
MTVTDQQSLYRPVSIAPLITFRITFGVLMMFSLLRFWWRGWITSIYIEPQFHFTYPGFDWVQPLGNLGMHLLFATIIISTVLIILGCFYRIAMLFFFLAFTYVELIDASAYLNHYYFISLVAFIMVFLPANGAYSLDVYWRITPQKPLVPAWTIDILRFQLSIVYIFAGLAKINPDWLIHAEPMKTWLPAKSHLPIVGPWMYETWVAYLFSWFGAVYDLFIVFFLLNKKTRLIAYGFVLVFHLATALFFPGIGMFPYVMISASLIFFSAEFHAKLQSFLPGVKLQATATQQGTTPVFARNKILSLAIVLYVFLQLVIPLRFLLYPGHLFWTEEGYRFSWRVMLMEKSGTAYFTVKDKSGTQFYEVDNKKFLTPLQEKMMSTQPDMILQYAHHLAKSYQKTGLEDPQVYAEVYVSLNGDRSKPFIDSSVNLAAQKLSWKPIPWILPYKK